MQFVVPIAPEKMGLRPVVGRKWLQHKWFGEDWRGTGVIYKNPREGVASRLSKAKHHGTVIGSEFGLI